MGQECNEQEQLRKMMEALTETAKTVSESMSKLRRNFEEIDISKTDT